MDSMDRKRQRSDDEDDEMYDPSATQLPPHLMQDADKDDDYAPPPHQQQETYIPSYDRKTTHKEEHNHAISRQEHSEYIPRGPRHHDRDRGRERERQRERGYENHPNKRGRREVQLSYELEKANDLMRDLQRIGENPYELDKDFVNFAGIIAYFWGEELFRSNILKFIGASVTEYPHKLFHFSVVVILANARNEEVGKSFIEWIKARIEEVFVEDNVSVMDVDIENADQQFVEPQMANVNGWDRVKLLFRMLAVLSHIIEDVDSIVQFAADILNLAISLQSSNDKRSPLGEMMFYEFTISIPYLLANDRSNDDLKAKCQNLLNISKEFKVTSPELDVAQYAPLNSGCTPFEYLLKNVVSSVEEALENPDLFTDFSRIIQDGSKSMLEQKAEQDLVMSGTANAESKPEVGELKKHILGGIKLPSSEELKLMEDLSKSKSNVDKLWRSPRFLIEIFANENVRKSLEFKTLPPVTSYVSLIVRDIVDDIVLNVEYNRVSVSRQLLSLASYFNSRIFALPNSPLDKLMIINDLKNSNGHSDLIGNLEGNTEFPEHIKKQMIQSAQKIMKDYEEGFNSTWKIEEIFLETILNLMFHLPKIDLPLVYFESLLMDTSGRDWALSKRVANENECLTFTKLLGDTFRYFYDNISSFKHETFVIFIDWFVYQISNFKFEWEWQEWVPDVLHIGTDSIYNKKISFIRNVIHKEILITSYKYIKNKTLPHDFKHFANLALNDRLALKQYDSCFFGEAFAEANTQDPFRQKDDIEYSNEEYERIIETNTDAYKLFDQYFFNHHDHIYHDICRDVYMNLENIEASVDEFLQVINRLRENIENTPDEQKIIQNVDQYIITLVIQSVCLIGSRSFSVLEEGLHNLFGEKVRAILETVQNPLKSTWVIHAVLRLWNNEPRIGMLFLSRLNTYGTTPVDVVNAGWKYISSASIIPIQEIWMEQFLDNYIVDEDFNDIRNELVIVYFTNAVDSLKNHLNRIGQFDKAQLQVFADSEDDLKVGLKTLIEFIQLKYKYFTSMEGVEASSIMSILDEVESEVGKLY